MSFTLDAESVDRDPDHARFLRRRAREELDAAADASSHAATLIHAALAAAYAGRSRSAGDEAWMAANRLW